MQRHVEAGAVGRDAPRGIQSSLSARQTMFTRIRVMNERHGLAYILCYDCNSNIEAAATRLYFADVSAQDAVPDARRPARRRPGVHVQT